MYFIYIYACFYIRTPKNRRVFGFLSGHTTSSRDGYHDMTNNKLAYGGGSSMVVLSGGDHQWSPRSSWLRLAAFVAARLLWDWKVSNNFHAWTAMDFQRKNWRCKLSKMAAKNCVVLLVGLVEAKEETR